MSKKLSMFPSFADDPDPRKFRMSELSRLTGSTQRFIRNLVSTGAIDPPIGRTKAARYVWKHVEDINAIKRTKWQKKLSTLKASEACHYDRPAQNGGARPKERVYPITDEIFVIASGEYSAVLRAETACVVAAARRAVMAHRR